MLRIPQSSSIIGTSPPDCLVSYPGHLLGVWPLCRDTFGVFYCPSRLGKRKAVPWQYSLLQKFGNGMLYCLVFTPKNLIRRFQIGCKSEDNTEDLKRFGRVRWWLRRYDSSKALVWSFWSEKNSRFCWWDLGQGWQRSLPNNQIPSQWKEQTYWFAPK